MWSDNEDLAVISDMFQIRIKIITIKRKNEETPTVNWIYPDPSMKELAELNVEMEDLVLLHEDDIHFNLIISKNSDLVKYGSLSKRFDCDDNSEASEEDIENEGSELTTVKNELEKYKAELKKAELIKSNVEKEYHECKRELHIKTEEVEKLKVEVGDLRTIVKLREELTKSKHDDYVMEIDEVDVNRTVLEDITKSGDRRKSPQN